MGEPWQFVGRHAERDSVLKSVTASTPRGVVLSGAAGVGKSRLLREVLTKLDRTRFPYLAAAATAATANLPLGAFAEILPPTPPMGANPTLLLRWALDAIRAHGGELPTILVVDDIHLLDPLGATVVLYACRSGAATLIATHRSETPVPDAISTLWKDDLVERTEVKALDEQQTTELLGKVLQAPVQQASATRLWQITEGNALLLREVLTSLEGTPELTLEHGSWTWSGKLPTDPALNQLVDERIGRLEDPVRKVLELVALGEPIGLNLIQRECGEGPVAQAEDSLLIRVVEDGKRQNVRLTHPIYGEVLRHSISVTRAHKRRAQLAELIESTGARRRQDLLRVAVLRLDSRTATDPSQLLRAAGLAFADLDTRLAARLAEAANNAGAGFPAQELFATAVGLNGDPQKALELLDEAAREHTSDWEVARIAVARSVQQMTAIDDSDPLAVLDDAIGRVTDPTTRAWIRAHIAPERMFYAFYEDLDKLLADINADPYSSEAAKQFAVTLQLAMRAWRGEPMAALRAIVPMERSSLSLIPEMPYLSNSIHYTLGQASLLAGDVIHIQGAPDQPEFFPVLEGQQVLNRAQALRMLGSTRQAQRLAQGALGHLHTGGRIFLPAVYAELAQCAAVNGDGAAEDYLVEAERTLTRARQNHLPWVGLARIQVDASAGRMEAARAAADDLIGILRRNGFSALEVLAHHTLTRAGLADAETGDRMAELASKVEGPLAQAAARHTHALLTGDVTELKSIVEEYGRLRLTLFATEAAAQAYQIKPSDAIAFRLADLLGQIEGVQTPALNLGMTALTERELEIADMAATGMSSRAIADQLVVSHRTPDNHLFKVYAKLGIAGRTELPARLRLYKALHTQRPS
ncbi:AAA family ATPase [Hamadaea flava]|uniref:AAA family ATPase n=1 Tax=Hamadaea flava TaxID=1742688 RepID=A0ABV8LLC7_9ACTN|nr:LuxR family transcriptional regulator [Hamadaea flava]